MRASQQFDSIIGNYEHKLQHEARQKELKRQEEKKRQEQLRLQEEEDFDDEKKYAASFKRLPPPPPKKSFMSRFGQSFKAINGSAWTIIITLFLAAVGAAYTLGNDNGKVKFDQEKINLDNANRTLATDLKNARDSVTSLLKQVQTLKARPDTTHK